MSYQKTGKIYQEVKAFCVYAWCDDYCQYVFRLRVFESFEKAKDFIADCFFQKDDEPAFHQENENRFFLKNLDAKDYKIVSKDDTGERSEEYFDVREVAIYIENLIYLGNGKFSQIVSTYDEECVEI